MVQKKKKKNGMKILSLQLRFLRRNFLCSSVFYRALFLYENITWYFWSWFAFFWALLMFV
jgi:hypothetical protein